MKARGNYKQKDNLRQNMDTTPTVFIFISTFTPFICLVTLHIFFYTFSMPGPLGSVRDPDTLVDQNTYTPVR